MIRSTSWGLGECAVAFAFVFAWASLFYLLVGTLTRWYGTTGRWLGVAIGLAITLLLTASLRAWARRLEQKAKELPRSRRPHPRKRNDPR